MKNWLGFAHTYITLSGKAKPSNIYVSKLALVLSPSKQLSALAQHLGSIREPGIILANRVLPSYIHFENDFPPSFIVVCARKTA